MNDHKLTDCCVIFPGAVTALVYALDKDTLYRLNWRTIRVSKPVGMGGGKAGESRVQGVSCWTQLEY